MGAVRPPDLTRRTSQRVADPGYQETVKTLKAELDRLRKLYKADTYVEPVMPKKKSGPTKKAPLIPSQRLKSDQITYITHSRIPVQSQKPSLKLPALDNISSSSALGFIQLAPGIAGAIKKPNSTLCRFSCRFHVIFSIIVHIMTLRLCIMI
jgi:hypothetical protein